MTCIEMLKALVEKYRGAETIAVPNAVLQSILDWMEAKENECTSKEATYRKWREEAEKLEIQRDQLQTLLDAAYAELGKNPDAKPEGFFLNPEIPITALPIGKLYPGDKQPSFWDGLELAKMMEEGEARRRLLKRLALNFEAPQMWIYSAEQASESIGSLTPSAGETSESPARPS